MCAQLLTIDRKTRSNPIYLVDVDADFQYTPGAIVDPTIVLENPQWGVYCLDDARRRAILVETPSHVDLSVVPLVYVTQYEYAERLLAITYDELIALADAVTTPPKVILIFHSSRCGSTLLSRAFSEISHVASFSEPDYMTQLVHLRELDGSRDAELAAILRACILLGCRPTQHKPDATTYAFKPRGEVHEIGDLFRQAVPDSVNLMIYRNAKDTLNSWLGAFPRMGIDAADPVPSEENNAYYKNWKQYGGTGEFTFYDFFISHWLSSMDAYLNLYRNGMPFLAVRYETLNKHRERALEAILDYCQISGEHVADMLRAFGHDSQAGTTIARENPREGNRYEMTDGEQEKLLSFLRMQPVINTSDYTAPGTLKLT